MKAEAIIGGEDRGVANMGSPRELEEDIAPVGEKLFYKGVHDQADKGLIVAFEENIPETDRMMDPEEKYNKKE